MPLRQQQEAETIESLTEAAHIAASRGEWNLVIACYERRGGLLTESVLSTAAVSRVLALDMEVAERARLAQSGVASLLRDVGVLRRRLRDLSQLAGTHPTDSGSMARHV
jgi:hypothetical protein